MSLYNILTHNNLITFVDSCDAVISEVARAHQTDGLSLRLQLLLHLPRIIDRITSPKSPELKDEAIRLAQIVSRRRGPYWGWSDAPSRSIVSPRELIFDLASEAEARVIHERFHYLGSFRQQDSQHYCLRTEGDGRLAALATLSAMDLVHIEHLLPDGLLAREVRVLSRVFAFDWASHNSLSFLFGRLLRTIENRQREIKVILTYVNPNMGFSGASYRASNWIRFGRELGTRYYYVDELYRTDRSLASEYGTTVEPGLRALLGPRLEVSKIDLEPLYIYAYFLERKRRISISQDLDLIFWRPTT